MKRMIKRLTVWIYLRSMNNYYSMAIWYQDHDYPAEARMMWAKGDQSRALWLKAQGAHRHPAFNSRHNHWVEALQDGGYEHQ